MKTFHSKGTKKYVVTANLENETKIDLEFEAEDVGDKYHTMSELYQHRMALTVALFNQLAVIYKLYGNVKVFKARKHFDGTMFDGGYFIVVACFDDGKSQISYHYDIKYWDLFKIESLDKVPFEYDGHTSNDVIERLLKL